MMLGREKMKPWFTHFSRPTPEAKARLLCLPYAGGGSAIFRPWLGKIDDIELYCALMPGREQRLFEPPLQSIEVLLESLVPAVAALADRPYFVFGHSLGGLIAFELTRTLRSHGLRLPHRLFVSAFRSPDRRSLRPEMHALPNEQFVDALRGYGGTPEELLMHQETMEILIPALRADFCMHETYRHLPDAPLPVPITALVGRSDWTAPVSEMIGWEKHTAAGFSIHEFDGAHFFIHDARKAVLDLLAENIRHDLNGPLIYG